MKRAEMSIGIVVALAIALIVLLLILAIVIPRFTQFGKGTNNAQNSLDARTCAKIGHCEATACSKGAAQTKPADGWIDCVGTCCVP